AFRRRRRPSDVAAPRLQWEAIGRSLGRIARRNRDTPPLRPALLTRLRPLQPAGTNQDVRAANRRRRRRAPPIASRRPADRNRLAASRPQSVVRPSKHRCPRPSLRVGPVPATSLLAPNGRAVAIQSRSLGLSV